MPVQRARKGLAAQNEAAYFKILAERRAGELLRAVERSVGVFLLSRLAANMKLTLSSGARE